MSLYYCDFQILRSAGCLVRVPEPYSTDSLGTQDYANFESHSNRVTFETNAISITSSIQPIIPFFLNMIG